MEDDFEDDILQFIMNVTQKNETETATDLVGVHFLLNYVLPPLTILVNIIGLIGNGTLVHLLRKPTQRNATNIFILNLAAADLMVLLFFRPFNDIYSIFDADYPFGKIMCPVSHALNKLALGASAFTLVALSAHTCRNEATPTPTPTLQCRREKRNAVVAVTVIWGLTITFAIPTLLLTHLVQTYDKITYEIINACLYSGWTHENEVLSSEIAVFYLIPLVAATGFLVVARRNSPGRIQKEYSSSVGVLVAVYAVCYLPRHLVSLGLIFDTDWSLTLIYLQIISDSFLISYRCLNPVALYCTSAGFRQLFNEHLWCWCAPKNKQEPVIDLELPSRAG